MPMKPEIKTRWTAKLREEDRQQTQHMLRDADGAQCCLDVLNEVAIEDEVINEPVFNVEEGKYEYVYEIENEIDGELETVHEYDTLPPAVQKWAGLESADPRIKSGSGADNNLCASGWNDVKCYSFLQIADLIDADETL